MNIYQEYDRNFEGLFINARTHRMDHIASFVKEHYPESMDKVIGTADLICKNQFIFNMDWDMEQTHEAVVFDGTIDWEHVPDDDPEWMYALNRHRYWIFLGQAYHLTGDSKYVTGFLEQFMHWRKMVPRSKENQDTSWRSIEAGLRCQYHLQAYGYFNKSNEMTDSFRKVFFDSIREHADYLMEVERPFGLISNWGVIENAGLYGAACVLGNSHMMQTAIRRLEACLKVQVLADGVHWEQSPMYHNEVLSCLLNVKLLAQNLGQVLPQDFDNTIKKMARVNLLWMKPDGSEFAQGDSDCFDLKDLLTKSAYLFKDPHLKYAANEHLDYMSAWELGEDAIESYQEIPADEPENSSAFLESSGNYYLRSSWGNKANLLHFSNGPIGGGHGHCEKLHMDLIANGEDVLIDCGRYTYVDKEERSSLKGAFGHNTLLVDGQSFMNPVGSWGFSQMADALIRPTFKSDLYEYVEGSHLGYIEQGIYVNRMIVFIKPDIYIVFDEVHGPVKTGYQQLFHFSNHGKVEWEKNHIWFESKKSLVHFHFMENVGINNQIAKHSRFYNQLEEHICLAIENTKRNHNHSTVVIDINPCEDAAGASIKSVQVKSCGQPFGFDQDQLECIKISKGDRHYLVFNPHGEVAASVNLYEAEGKFLTGRFQVLEL